MIDAPDLPLLRRLVLTAYPVPETWSGDIVRLVIDRAITSQEEFDWLAAHAPDDYASFTPEGRKRIRDRLLEEELRYRNLQH
jgi:hypothetical protein